MSYEGTTCPCGDKKAPGTMLCDGCMTEFADHSAMATFQDTTLCHESRRQAAIILVTLARKRRHK